MLAFGVLKFLYHPWAGLEVWEYLSFVVDALDALGLYHGDEAVEVTDVYLFEGCWSDYLLLEWGEVVLWGERVSEVLEGDVVFELGAESFHDGLVFVVFVVGVEAVGFGREEDCFDYLVFEFYIS